MTDVCLFQTKSINLLDYDLEKALEYFKTNEIPEEKKLKVQNSLEKFKNKDHITHRTNQRRVFNTFTNLTSKLREFVKDDLVYIDCVNSQPFLLVHYAKEKDNVKVEKELLDAVSNGKFYELFEGNREDIKISVFQTFYNNKGIEDNNKIFVQLKEKYPIFAKYLYKLSHDKSVSLAEFLQRIESNIWIDRVSKYLMLDDVKHFTIHDSVVVHRKDLQHAYNVVCDAFGNTQPSYHIKELKTGENVSVKDAETIKTDYEEKYKEYTFKYTVGVFDVGRFINKKEEPVEYVKVSNSNVIDFLKRNGVHWWVNNDKTSYLIEEGKVIDNIYVPNIKQIVSDHIKFFDCSILGRRPEALSKQYLDGKYTVTSEKTLAYLKQISIDDISGKADTKDSAYIPFRNGLLKITKDGYELLPMTESKKLIWKDSIKQINFKKVDFSKSIIKDFYSKSIVQHKSFDRILGYMLHNYKNRALAKHIVILDQDLENKNRGGAGKSIIAQFVGMIRNVVTVDAKKEKTDKQLGMVNYATDLVVFDDLKEFSDFEALNNMVTGDLEVDAKYGAKFTIPFDDAPKIISTSNYMIDRGNSGVSRRTILLETTDHFNKDHTPFDEYGMELVKDWDEEQTNIEINYLVHCISEFLKHGLPNIEITNEEEKLMDFRVGKDYENVFDYVTRNGSTIITVDMLKDLISKFLGYSLNSNKEMRIVNKKFNEYCKLKNYEIDKNVTIRYHESTTKAYRIRINGVENYPMFSNK